MNNQPPRSSITDGFVSDHRQNQRTFILGGIIGLEKRIERETCRIQNLRHLSVASCVVTIVSMQSAEYYAEISMNIRSDPMRLAAQIISGRFSGGGSDSASTRRCYFRPDDGGHCGHLPGLELPAAPVLYFHAFSPRVCSYWR